MAAGEKRIKHIDDLLLKASIVLLDIEGTTTSISFVKDTLFPYIRSNLELYLKAHWNDAEFQDDLLLLKEQAKQDEIDKVDGVVVIPENNEDNMMDIVARNVLWQMDLDRKTKALKQLQGHIMREGYEKGTLKGHVYPDVVPALKSWARSGRHIYIYSSGSVEAQKLLFGHSQEGSILELFAGHFDTSVGPKVESVSYMNIVKTLECRNEDVLFLTDVPREARAAVDAGLNAVLVDREGNEPLTEEDKMDFPVIRSFQDFVFEVSAKRKKMSCHDEPCVLVESPTNEASDGLISDKVQTVYKTEVTSLESAGSGNIRSSVCELEMMDVSNNDVQETVKTDRIETEFHVTDTKMVTEDGDTKTSGKTEFTNNGSEVSKTGSSPPELETVEASASEKVSAKPCCKTAGQNGSESMSETAVKIKSAEVGVKISKMETAAELNDSKTDQNKPTADVESTEAVSTDGIPEVPANVEEEIVDREGTWNTDIEVNPVRKGFATVDSEHEIGSGDEKTNLSEAADAGDRVADAGTASSHEEESAKVMDVDNMATQMTAEVTEGMEKESLVKLGGKEGTRRNITDVKSDDNEGMKEERKSSELSEESSVNKEGAVIKLQSEIIDKTESDNTVHQLPDKQSLNGPSAGNHAPRDNKSLEINEAEHSKPTAELRVELPATDASREESTSKHESGTDNISLDKMEDISTTVENSSTQIPVAASNVDTAEANAIINEGIKAVELNEEEKLVDESSTVENTAKANGLAATTKNGTDDDISNTCPDSEQNGEVKDAEHDVTLKKLSVDGSGNKDDGTPIPGVTGS